MTFKGWVYFVQPVSGGLVKIGFTLGEPHHRLAQLDPCSPVPLVILGCIWAFPAKEKELHLRFASARVRYEWFEPVPELMDYIGRKSRRLRKWLKPVVRRGRKGRPVSPVLPGRPLAGLLGRSLTIDGVTRPLWDWCRIRQIPEWSAEHDLKHEGKTPETVLDMDEELRKLLMKTYIPPKRWLDAEQAEKRAEKLK